VCVVGVVLTKSPLQPVEPVRKSAQAMPSTHRRNFSRLLSNIRTKQDLSIQVTSFRNMSKAVRASEGALGLERLFAAASAGFAGCTTAAAT